MQIGGLSFGRGEHRTIAALSFVDDDEAVSGSLSEAQSPAAQ